MGVPLKLFAALSLAASFLIYRLELNLPYNVSAWTVGFGTFFMLSFLFWSWDFVLYPNFFSPLLNLPQPTGGSFFNGQFWRINKEPSGYPMSEWVETIPNKGLIYYTTLFNSQRVLLTNAKALQEVLVTKNYEFVKPDQIRNGLGRILGVGILLAEGDEHKRQRKLLNPAFSFRHIKDLYPIFWAKGREMVLGMHEAISNKSANNTIEVSDWASRTTLDIIGVSGMGKDFNSLQDPTNELFQTYRKIFSPSTAARILAVLAIVLPPALIRVLPVQRNDDIQEASNVIKRTARNLIRRKREALESGKGDDGSVDIISVALKSGGFSDEDLVNQLMTFLAAGHETTASSMNWALLELCRRPEMQSRLRRDLHAAGIAPIAPTSFSPTSPPDTITAAQIESIPYLSAFCNEILRYHPPVGVTLRKAAHATTILDQPIPAGTNVIISPMANNFSSEMWGPTAGEFDPERWMAPGCANSGGAESNYAFMTFLHGPRSCIGSGFAKAEFMSLVAAWVASFHCELEDPARVIDIAGGVTSKPKGGLRVKIVPVES